jgi:hypothetical protein
VLRQICSFIPTHLVPKLARQTGVDKKGAHVFALEPSGEPALEPVRKERVFEMVRRQELGRPQHMGMAGLPFCAAHSFSL